MACETVCSVNRNFEAAVDEMTISLSAKTLGSCSMSTASPMPSRWTSPRARERAAHHDQAVRTFQFESLCGFQGHVARPD
jgi:hypothetical protein